MEVIEDKTKVSIAYVLLEKGGRILEEIPATHPFVYIHGYNNIIPGLETALAGRKLGERFSVDIPANLGYGPYCKTWANSGSGWNSRCSWTTTSANSSCPRRRTSSSKT